MFFSYKKTIYSLLTVLHLRNVLFYYLKALRRYKWTTFSSVVIGWDVRKLIDPPRSHHKKVTKLHSKSLIASSAVAVKP